MKGLTKKQFVQPVLRLVAFFQPASNCVLVATAAKTAMSHAPPNMFHPFAGTVLCLIARLWSWSSWCPSLQQVGSHRIWTLTRRGCCRCGSSAAHGSQICLQALPEAAGCRKDHNQHSCITVESKASDQCQHSTFRSTSGNICAAVHWSGRCYRHWVTRAVAWSAALPGAASSWRAAVSAHENDPQLQQLLGRLALPAARGPLLAATPPRWGHPIADRQQPARQWPNGAMADRLLRDRGCSRLSECSPAHRLVPWLAWSARSRRRGRISTTDPSSTDGAIQPPPSSEPRDLDEQHEHHHSSSVFTLPGGPAIWTSPAVCDWMCHRRDSPARHLSRLHMAFSARIGGAWCAWRTHRRRSVCQSGGAVGCHQTGGSYLAAGNDSSRCSERNRAWRGSHWAATWRFPSRRLSWLDHGSSTGVLAAVTSPCYVPRQCSCRSRLLFCLSEKLLSTFTHPGALRELFFSMTCSTVHTAFPPQERLHSRKLQIKSIFIFVEFRLPKTVGLSSDCRPFQ